MLPIPRVQSTREMQNLVMVVMMVRGMAAVLSSDLTQCLGVGVPPWWAGGAGTALAADQGLGEQSGGFSGLRPCSPGCFPCLHLHRGHNSHDCG